MSTGPEWIWFEVTAAVERLDGRAQPARCWVGMVRADGGDAMLAITIAADPADGTVYILPPHAATRVISALRRGLREIQ